jgi:hypothetical protein
MAKSILIILSNPVSAEREDEFNAWYSNVHGPEVAALPGFKSVARYRAATQVLPRGAELTHRYLALYEADDADQALASMAAAAPQLTMSDSADLAGANGIMFELIPAPE